MQGSFFTICCFFCPIQSHPSSVVGVPMTLPISAAHLVSSAPVHDTSALVVTGDATAMVSSPNSVSESTAGRCGGEQEKNLL